MISILFPHRYNANGKNQLLVRCYICMPFEFAVMIQSVYVEFVVVERFGNSGVGFYISGIFGHLRSAKLLKV